MSIDVDGETIAKGNSCVRWADKEVHRDNITEPSTERTEESVRWADKEVHRDNITEPSTERTGESVRWRTRKK